MCIYLHVHLFALTAIKCALITQVTVAQIFQLSFGMYLMIFQNAVGQSVDLIAFASPAQLITVPGLAHLIAVSLFGHRFG